MNNSEHTSIDVNKLADSLRWKLESVYPSSEDCCIYRVPQSKRCLNPSDYTPQTVSIGPLHHGKGELKAMEEHKIRYLRQFLKRTRVSVEDFLAFIKDKEARLRNSYEETIQLESDDFVTMMLVDAVFLIEFFLRGCEDNFITDDDRIFGKPWIDITCDLLLVENQIPLFILNELFDLAKTATYGDYYHGLSLSTITLWFRMLVRVFVPMHEYTLETKFAEAVHLSDFLRLCARPSYTPLRANFIPQNMPSAMQLHQAGVKFKNGSSENRLDIKFDKIKGVLEIPFFTVYDSTERFYRNILAFEHMHGDTQYFNDYVTIMSDLVHTAKDAELLIQNGVIGLGNSEKSSSVFRNAVKEGYPTSYSDLVEDLQTYCKSRRNQWKATLKQQYFNTPWASISVIAAVILLVLTFVQTACSIIAL